jgi:parallel beta-helix repeat protein
MVRCAVAIALIVAVAAVIRTITAGQGPASASNPVRLNPRAALDGASPPSAGTPVCGQAILNSPWSYAGPPGTFRASGTPAGLPTFGAAGTDFPGARSILVIPAGDNTKPARLGIYNVNNTVVYFEPGVHRISGVMYTGHGSAYVGGYTAAAGKAILDGVDGGTDGTGKGGSFLSYSTPSSGDNVYDTWKYLTIENYASIKNNSVMGNVNGGGADNGDVYEYDTIGPNEYGYRSQAAPPGTGQSSGGGYGIDVGSNNTIEYNCLTQNAQGAFNSSDSVSLVAEHNEISRNGLGEYPDTGGPGASPYGCGCSGGAKIFFSLNADVTGNYVHDNYNAGIWFDFDNAGADVSGNYIASNWGPGIMYEASYNASITDNTLVGNGWDSDGLWPAGTGGHACYGNVSCRNGEGPITGAGGGNPYAAIDLSGSGGNSALTTVAIPAGSRPPGCGPRCAVPVHYAGHLLVEGNVLTDNFGGVKIFTDTNRYPGNIDGDSTCGLPLGALGVTENGTYYQQTRVLVTPDDATISGAQVTSTSGTQIMCADYGMPASDAGPASGAQAASPGMAVFDLSTGAFLGTVTSVTGPRSFRLSRAPGNQTHAGLLLSAYGGCGPADYAGGGPGVASGHPVADYWDNCIWGAANVTVSHNVFSINAAKVTGCGTLRNMCGYMEAAAFNAGVPTLMQFWDRSVSVIARASGGLGNVWSDNAYQWSGGGLGWQFEAGAQGSLLSQDQWQDPPTSQDAGSSFGS